MGSSLADAPLGACVELTRGTTYKSALLDRPGPFLLGLASIARNGGFRSDSLRTYGGDSPERLLLRPGDLYVSLKDVTQSGDLLGSVARVPVTIPLGRLTQDTVKLTLGLGAPPRDYLFWVLRSPEYREHCRAHAIGTTNLSISRDDFLSFLVPAATEQRLRLVELLEAIEQKIEMNRRTTETLEAMARALFKSWFIDFDPVRAKADGKQPAGMDAETAALFPSEFVDSEMGEIPKGWRQTPVGELAGLNGWTLAKADQLEHIDYIEISEVSKGNVNLVQRYQRGKEPSRARRRLRHGDTVLSTVRPERGSFFACINPSDSLIASTGFATLTPRSVPWSLLYSALTQPAVFEYLGQHADGGAYPAVRPEVIGAMVLTTPATSTVAQRFHVVSEPLLLQADANRKQAQLLASVRDALLPRLLSGELTIPNAERTVEATR